MMLSEHLSTCSGQSTISTHMMMLRSSRIFASNCISLAGVTFVTHRQTKVNVLLCASNSGRDTCVVLFIYLNTL